MVCWMKEAHLWLKHIELIRIQDTLIMLALLYM